jgi:hypothetical protein
VGKRYIHVSSGPVASYFVRDDGVVDRAKSGGKVESEMTPPAGIKYVNASAGMDRTYLLRDDGKIDQVRGGKVDATLEPKDAGKGTVFVGCSDQLTIQTDKTVCGPWANYLVRSDGVIERVTTKSSEHQLIVPAKGKYIQASAGASASYLLREDGVVCRTQAKGEIKHEMVPAGHGVTYVQCGAGGACSYLLRSDGQIDRTVPHRNNGAIGVTMKPPGRQAWLDYNVSHAETCALM